MRSYIVCCQQSLSVPPASNRYPLVSCKANIASASTHISAFRTPTGLGRQMTGDLRVDLRYFSVPTLCPIVHGSNNHVLFEYRSWVQSPNECHFWNHLVAIIVGWAWTISSLISYFVVWKSRSNLSLSQERNTFKWISILCGRGWQAKLLRFVLSHHKIS